MRFVLEITDLKFLEKLYLDDDDIKSILSKQDIDKQYLHEKPKKCGNKSKAPLQEILEMDPKCLEIEELLTVPFGKDIAVKQIFYFCPSAKCVSKPPVWSNVRFPNVVLKEADITNEELTALQNELIRGSTSQSFQ